MNKTTLATIISTAALAAASFAGQPMYAPSKEVVVPPPVYGTGWYFGLQIGANLLQDYGGGGSVKAGRFDVSYDYEDEVGFFGGLKLGYVFGTGSIRPALELDGYYNGFKGGVNIDVSDSRGEFKDRSASADAEIHSGALLANFLVRFGTGRFQPYIGAGAGVYYASVDNVDVSIGGRTVSTDGGGDATGFAWQLVGGADYYFSEKWSAFLEYKFLNYEQVELAGEDDAVRQHLLGVGMRWHF